MGLYQVSGLTTVHSNAIFSYCLSIELDVMMVMDGRRLPSSVSGN